MKYADAKKLHNGDEVTVKETKEILWVVSVEVKPKHVYIFCEDGNTYHHTEVK